VGLVAEHFAELAITRISRWCFNCYLLTGDDGLIVVDPGMPGVADDIATLLAGNPRTLRTVTATHGHPDHIGGAAKVAERWGAEVHLPATTIGYLEDGVTPRTPTMLKLARTWRLLFGQPFDAKALLGFARASSTVGFGTPLGMRWRGARPAGGLEDGMPLPGASAWQVLNCPGHTDDSVALWNEQTRSLLSGDAVITVNGRPVFAPDTVDEAASARTFARLSALPVEHLLPGHGLPIHYASPWQPVASSQR
jgi:glyoxylase-like metal-dependent hydrolase (beta-lactamase superfamily II)